MKSKILNVIVVFTGSIFVFLGVFGVFFGVIAILDPVGTQLSDDSNPFGSPPTTIESLTLTFVYFLILILGICLIYGTHRLNKSYSEKNEIK